MLGDGSKRTVLCFLRREKGVGERHIPQRLKEVDEALDTLFTTPSSTLIKYVTVQRICSALRIEPPGPGKSLQHVVAEIHSSLGR